MIVAALIVVLTSVGVYWAAEQRGRSGAIWFIVTFALVAGSYAAADLAAAQLAGSNAIFESGSGATALVVVLAGPLAGIAAALALAWWIMQSAPVARLGQAVTMHGGYEGRDEDGDWGVRVDGHELVLTPAGRNERRIAASEVDVEVDGEYLSLRIPGEDDPLLLRPRGPKYPDRDLRVAVVNGLAKALGSGRR